tara:strand:- start:1333 stop:2235 length:903 start_codon:yes stop_codon:yes gene_type:complete
VVCSILVDKSSIWIKYSVRVPAEFVEPVVRMFSKFLTNNVYVEQLGDPEDGIEKLNTRVSGFLPKKSNTDKLESNLKSGLSLFSGVFDLSEILIEEINSDVWEKQEFEPIEINDIQILPSKDYSLKEGYIGIVIEPSMAFGTGHHPTTKMCISLIKKYVSNNFNVLDLGCGSGVLGIVSIKYGAKYCLSLDIEEESIKATNQNSIDSNVKNIESKRMDLTQSLDINFIPEMIIGNLNSYLFKEGIKNIENLMGQNTIMIASGVLIENYKEINKLFIDNGLLEIDKQESGDWTALVLQKNA